MVDVKKLIKKRKVRKISRNYSRKISLKEKFNRYTTPLFLSFFFKFSKSRFKHNSNKLKSLCVVSPSRVSPRSKVPLQLRQTSVYRSKTKRFAIRHPVAKPYGKSTGRGESDVDAVAIHVCAPIAISRLRVLINPNCNWQAGVRRRKRRRRGEKEEEWRRVSLLCKVEDRSLPFLSLSLSLSISLFLSFFVESDRFETEIPCTMYRSWS